MNSNETDFEITTQRVRIVMRMIYGMCQACKNSNLKNIGTTKRVRIAGVKVLISD